MPTRTAFIITIGDVLESGPPRANRSNSKNQAQSGVDESDDSATSRPPSPASSTYSDAPRPRRFRKRKIMKTRVSNTGGTSATLVATSGTSNGPTNGSAGRRPRLQSVDQVYLGNSNNNPLSPRTRSTTKQEVDEEVSFVDPLGMVDVKIECNGENGLHEDSEDPLLLNEPPTKKKRKSSAEKFLEDNSEYYGFQDDEKRTIKRHRSASHCEDQKSDRSRHSSGASAGTTKRRIRANSSSSSHHNECVTTGKKLRVEVTKLDLNKMDASDWSSCDELLNDTTNSERPLRKKLRSKPNNSSASISPSSKKRRSELDKLLEAGLSSFHCETAKQAADRLGPLQVDVSDNNSGSEASYEDKKPASKNSRLLQEAAPDVNQNSKGKKGRKPKKTSNRGGVGRNIKTENSDISPNTSCGSPTIPDLDDLKRIDGSEIEHTEMEFSFERTPFREGWFQTYSRQDLGDEMLYYSDHQFFPLPYEMPMNTFYPWRDKPGKKSTKNTPEASGTATPVLEDEDSIPTPMRTTRGKSIKKNLNEASFFDKIDPKKAAALKSSEFSRKSPRGHASTKSLLNHATSPYVDDDDEVFEEMLQGDKKLAYLDECSNDSVLSISSKKNFKTETIGQLMEIANNLDTFLCEEDPLLMAQATSESPGKKRSRRQSSSDKSKSRSNRRSKDHDQAHPGLDKIVDSNIDPIFLDCLEDELPSVTFEDPVRSNNPMEWLDTYDQCTSINLLSKRSKKLAKLIAEHEKLSKDSESDQNLVVCHSKDPQSTILRRLLTHSPPRSPSRNSKLTKKNRNFVKPNDPVDDSSSECASVSESVASSNSTRRKKKRNMTGFPSPKKKRKLITPSLTPKAGQGNSNKPQRQKLCKTGRLENVKSPGKKKRNSVQMEIKLNRNGMSLQKPTKPSSTSPNKTGKRGRPVVAKSKQPKQPQNSSKLAKLPKGAIKGRRVFMLSEDEDPVDDDESFSDEEDCNFSPGKRNKPKKAKKNQKKKKRRLTLPQKKKFLLVKPGQKPKVITIESNDEKSSEDENDEKDEDKHHTDFSEEESDEEVEEENEENSDEENEENSSENEENSSNEEENEEASDEESENEESEQEKEDNEDMPIKATRKNKKNLRRTRVMRTNKRRAKN